MQASTKQTIENLRNFVAYAHSLTGDEKGEAPVFCERLFRAFGHEGLKEAGAIQEYRIRHTGKSTKFADLLWRPHLLLEMKKRGEKLERHYRQIFEYWLRLVPQRPKYVVLCNFDEFWIYDFDKQLEEPVDKVLLEELPNRYMALNFLSADPDKRRPQFGNDRVAVTQAAADKVAQVFNSLVSRGEEQSEAQRFVLQCVVALFSEDFDLLPRGFFTEIIEDCRNGQSAYDLIGNLFRQMGTQSPAKAGRYKGIPYFNGGIFQVVEPMDLNSEEIELLAESAAENWGKVQPQIFGTLFQSSMGKEERHAYGAHFTSEADIEKIITPTIVRPWRERVEAADTLRELQSLRRELLEFKVLDPACGAGDFLYIAYRELKRIEIDLLAKIHDKFSSQQAQASVLSPRQFFGIEKNPFGAELAKVTMVLGKELALKETQDMLKEQHIDLPLDFDAPLPLDNLERNIICDDALFHEWPKVNAIVGNPPYQSKNKLQDEFGAAYANLVRSRYPEVSGKADYCVYWFRKAHDELAAGQRAGLVGTNTIRQNDSREGSLDHISQNGGTITEAVSTQVWSGEAAVHVSIVNWIKGEESGTKRLYRQLGDRRDSNFEMVELDHINAALSGKFDVTSAEKLVTNADAPACYQGQTHGHEGFLLTPDEAQQMIEHSSESSEVLFPYLIADDLLGNIPPAPRRYAIDFHPQDQLSATRYSEPFGRLKDMVLPARQEKADKEERRNKTTLAENPKAKVNKHHRNFLNRWWLMSYVREPLIQRVSEMTRYIVCGRVTKRPIFEFVSSNVRPNDALQVFPLPDDYSFGILQSDIHWLWFVERCSTLKGDFRYTSDTVFDSFPWPQQPSVEKIDSVAEAAVSLRELRRSVMSKNSWNFRELYRTLELPGANPLKEAHTRLDQAVRAAYGMDRQEDPLTFLLALNGNLVEQEKEGQPITGPGLPSSVDKDSHLVTADCITTYGWTT
ncbi:class I SAM-dependent DNA methyltransferase [Rubrobacter aplysinae]|uniref:class I SAM-dependent DNA methyltransferase n=1 Tax=Rubrobacter aplysinae TaxID=909625 RepID=UPI00064C12B5|nr:DNA methyltransferase [Rubrobacter aplysinae]